MRLLRLLVAALCLATLAVTVPAHALGTLTVSTTAPMWTGRTQTDRKLDIINRQDCLDDATISFQATFGNNPGGAFEVWAGTSCETTSARMPTTATCVKVFSGSSGTNQTVTVRVQGLVRATSDDPTNAAAGTKSACDATQSTSLSTRVLHFLVFDPGSNMSLIAATPKWTYKYDTVGPNPPTNVSAGSGESSLTPRFTAPTGESNVIRYHFYCSTVSASATGSGGTTGNATAGTAGTDAATAGTTTDTGGTGGTGGTDAVAMSGADTGGAPIDLGTAGTTTGGTAGSGATAGTAGTDTTSAGADTTGAGGESSGGEDPTCVSSTLTPGADPAGLEECGSVSARGSSDGQTNDSLENGVRYAVAVAAEDDANNIGKLSKLACGVPQEVTGFFEAYRDAGGQAGGGYCTFAPARRGAAAMAVFMLLGACALVARRRK
jgi:hypothetical protein